MRFTRPRSRPLLFTAALLVLVVALVGCGGKKSHAGAAGTSGKAAEAVPASALAFFDVNIDTGSDAWKSFQDVSSRFPSWAMVTAKVQQGFMTTASNGETFQNTIEPWLGSEGGVAITGVSGLTAGGQPMPQFVVYVESKDDAKLKSALTKGGQVTAAGSYSGFDLYTRKSGTPYEAAVGKGALLLGSDDATVRKSIDLLGGSGDRLSDSKDYKDTLAALPSSNLAVGYVSGPGVKQLFDLGVAAAQSGALPGSLQTIPTSAPALAQVSQALGDIRTLGLSFGAEDQGYRTRVAVLGEPGKLKDLYATKPFTPSLTASAPSTSAFFYDIAGLGPALQKAIGKNPQTGAQLNAAAAQIGLSVNDDIVPLLAGELAVYADTTAATPTVGLVLKPDDVNHAAATLKKVTALLGSQGGAHVTDLPGGDGQTIAGADGTSLTVTWRKVGDTIVISNDASAGSPATGLDKGAYADLAKAVGADGDVSGIAYLSVPALLAYEAAHGSTSMSATEQANFGKVGGVLFWSKISGDTATSDLFVQVNK